jgi:quercetin dioxygenase-like cupin family protein
MTKSSRYVLSAVFLMAGALFAQDAQVTPLMSRDLPEFPGKEGVMITVVYPPGASDPIHRHNAHAFVYVLEGTIVMQLKGGKEITLAPGQTFYEGPHDIHVLGRNASTTKPAKFVVLLVKNKDAPVLVPVK